MKDLKKKLSILKAYKLQLDSLGYIVVEGELKDVNVYRDLLRSGKQPKIKQHSNNRVFQYNELLQRYFNLKYAHVNITIICTYKQMISYIATGISKESAHNKAVVNIANKLVNKGYIQVIELADQGKLIHDTFNDNLYHFTKGELYRVINGKTLKVN